MLLYIIRHADPDYAHNTITEFGWEEARALAAYLKDKKIDKIYTSPLGRAIDTATPTCEAKGMDYTILPWTAESMDYMAPNNRPGNMSYRCSFTGGIEDYTDFSNVSRGDTVTNMIKSSDEFLASLGYVREGFMYRVTEPNHNIIAVFCHGGFGSAWISHLLMRPAEMGFTDISLPTTSISTFSFGNTPRYPEHGNRIIPMCQGIGATFHIDLAGLRHNNR